jgi:RNA 2',3'-cyclic 3'-phosphodiesterase
VAATGGLSIRAFVALDLDEASVMDATRLADRLGKVGGAPKAAWTAADKMHVTVKFAGELPVAAVEPVAAALRPLALAPRVPWTCPLEIGAFPGIGRARVLVLELRDEDATLARLAAAVDERFAPYGVAREERAFRPHITLARLKRPHDARRWLREERAGFAGACTLIALTLYRSELNAEGAVHTPLARFTLAAPLT